MLLLVTGPVIGQLSAFDKSGHHHSDVPMAAMAPAPHHTLGGVIDWHEQCGYCSLFQHFPVLTGVLPPMARMPLPIADEPSADTRSAHGSLAVFPHALTRAPPSADR